MKPQVRATRALAAYTAARSLRLISKILLVIFIVIVTIIGLLAIKASSLWWWLLPFVLLIGVIVWLLRLVVKRIIHTIYPDPLSQSQRKVLDNITDKAAGIAEARSTPMFILAFTTLKDIIVKRDPAHVKKLFSDSASLVDDLSKLEKEFKDR